MIEQVISECDRGQDLFANTAYDVNEVTEDMCRSVFRAIGIVRKKNVKAAYQRGFADGVKGNLKDSD